MAKAQDEKFKKTLRRMLGSRPQPHKTTGKKKMSQEERNAALDDLAVKMGGKPFSEKG